MKKPALVILFSCLAAAVAGAWWWEKSGAEYAVVQKSLPPAPDLTSARAVLRERIAAAEGRAQSRISAAKGLKELSRLYHANGFLEEATRCYQGLEKLEPANARWLHLHATILAGFGEIDEATRLWRMAVQRDPNYVPSQLRLGDCLLKSNHLEEAASIYAEVLRKTPENSYALLGLARIDYEKKHWQDARAKLERVVAQTNYNLGYDLIVTVYMRLGEEELARAVRRRVKASGAFRDAPDPWLDELISYCVDPYRIAIVAGAEAQAGDTAKAVLLLKQAISLAPDDVSSHFQLGCLDEAQKDFAGAREQLELCTVLSPEFADGWTHLSTTLSAAGNDREAERVLGEGLQKCPGSPGLHLLRAQNLRRMGRTEEAIGEYLVSIRLRPNEPEAYTELGAIYLGLGRTDEGIEKMRDALNADPGDPMALGILAFYSISVGDYGAANQWLARVANQLRTPPEQTARLLDAYRQKFGHDWAPAAKDQ